MMDFISELWRDGWPGKLMILMLPFGAMIICIVCWALVKEAEQWEAFKVEHKCKPVEHVKGQMQVSTIIGADGKPATVISQEPDRIGWLCDDGVTYYR